MYSVCVFVTCVICMLRVCVCARIMCVMCICTFSAICVFKYYVYYVRSVYCVCTMFTCVYIYNIHILCIDPSLHPLTHCEVDTGRWWHGDNALS